MTPEADIMATTSPIQIGDKTFLLSPMTDSDLGYLDRWVQTRHIRMARESLLPDASDAQRELTERIALEQAMGLSWMWGKGLQIINTVEGWATILWTGLRRNHSDLTPDHLVKLLIDPKNLEAAQKQWKDTNAVAGSQGVGKTTANPTRTNRRRGRTAPKSTGG